MNFFDELVIPASENHIMLLKYMLTISLLLFIPYISMMLGATFISTHFNKKGKNEGNSLYLRFAKDVIEKLTITKSAELALGTIPVISTFFAYAQLLYTAKTISVGMFALAVILFIISFVFIYKYRNTFKLEGIMNAFRNISGKDALKSENESVAEIKDFEESVSSTNSISGTVGKWLLLTASYIFAGSMALASSPDKWPHVGNILQIIFSWQTLFNFGALISLAGIITGGAIMFSFFSWDGGLKDMTDEYAAIVITTAPNRREGDAGGDAFDQDKSVVESERNIIHFRKLTADNCLGRIDRPIVDNVNSHRMTAERHPLEAFEARG